MFQNYLKIAWRNLHRNRLHSIINISGLTIGVASFLVIMLYVFTQYQYDNHHESGTSLYRVETELRGNEDAFISATISPPIVPMMLEDFPEVVNATRIVDPPETSHHLLKWQNNSYFETKGYYVDSLFFNMFDYDWLEGTPDVSLMEPYTIVLTRQVKEKLFGRQNALGEFIEINNRFGNDKFRVTGVVDPGTYKSHIRANFYMSMNSGGMGEYVRTNDQWAGGNFVYGYIELHPSADPLALSSKLPDFLLKYGSEQLKEFGLEKILTLQPVQEIHLNSARDNQIDKTANTTFLNILLFIASFILALACINFMNLATAQSLKKSIEVGVRKTIGAKRLDIANQFFIESFLVVGIALGLSIAIAYYSLPFISSLVEEPIESNLLYSPVILMSIVGIYLITALISGSYPAILSSSYRPIAAIKGTLQKSSGNNPIRKSLVVLQFTIATTMVIGSIVIMSQLQFIQNKDLGFNPHQKIVVPFRTSSIRTHLNSFRNEAKSLAEVRNVAGARIYPGQFMAQDFNLYKEGGDNFHSHNVKLLQGDDKYFETLGIPILLGRNFFTSDTASQILVNQTALKTFNIPENQAIGTKLYSDYQNQIFTREIVGVTKDYNQGSLKEPIKPMIFEYRSTERSHALLIDIYIDKEFSIIKNLESKWNSIIKDVPFEYHFLDEQIQSLYIQESLLAKLINILTFIAIFISCLGLFGLSVFMAEQRSKEIGIRKVLGATWPSILSMLSVDFFKLIIISLFIASPVAWYFMREWLNGFEYRIEIEWSYFALAGLLILLTTFITVSFQSIRAAFSNPVNSLRNE